MLVGLEWPDSGTVAFDGTPLQRANLQAQRQRIGYVIQEGGLFPHLDARSNATCWHGRWVGRLSASRRAWRRYVHCANCQRSC